MNIERPSEVGQPRRRVWCTFADIQLVSDKVYSFVNLPTESLGEGSEVIVMDKPGMLLFYHISNGSGLLYDWSV